MPRFTQFLSSPADVAIREWQPLAKRLVQGVCETGEVRWGKGLITFFYFFYFFLTADPFYFSPPQTTDHFPPLDNIFVQSNLLFWVQYCARAQGRGYSSFRYDGPANIYPFHSVRYLPVVGPSLSLPGFRFKRVRKYRNLVYNCSANPKTAILVILGLIPQYTKWWIDTTGGDPIIMNHSLVALLKFRMSNFICRSCSKLLIFLNHYYGKSSAGWLAGSKTEFKSPPPPKKA